MGDTRTSIAITDQQIWLACYEHCHRRWEQTALARAQAEVPTCLQPTDALAPLAQQIIDLVRQQTQSVVTARLVIPGTWIYGHSLQNVTTARKALAYDLEPHLPYALEDLAVAFASSHRDHLGIAILAAPVATLLDALEAAGILVEYLGVDGIEAADGTEATTVWLDDRHATVLALGQGKPRQLEVIQYLSGQAQTALLEWFRRYRWQSPDQADAMTSIVLRGKDATSIAHMLRPHAPIESPDAHQDTDSQAPLPLLRPDPANGLDLRCGLLTFKGRFQPLRKGLVQVLVLLAVLNLLLAGHWSLQTRHNNQIVGQIHLSEQVLWKQVFPERLAPPAGIGLHIASERIRLEALTGSTDNKSLQRPDLLGLLRQVAQAIPKDTRILAQDLQINAQQLVIRGATRTHTEAEQINRSISSAKVLDVQPASSEVRSDGTVDFTMRASYVAKTR